VGVGWGSSGLRHPPWPPRLARHAFNGAAPGLCWAPLVFGPVHGQPPPAAALVHAPGDACLSGAQLACAPASAGASAARARPPRRTTATG
jgi:hypothetical protein